MRVLSFLLNAALAMSLILIAFAALGGLEAISKRNSNPALMPGGGVSIAAPAAPVVDPPPVQIAAMPDPSPATPANSATASTPTSPVTEPAPASPAAEPAVLPNKVIPITAASAPAPAAPPAAPAAAKVVPAAKDLFGAAKEPANLATRSIGFYAKGCLAGAQPLPISGPAWQAMRVSRNRNWGHPSLVKFLERFANDVREKDAWPGLLVGDMSMPRGGPMPFGHASHQVGLDVDIWYKPMPDHVLSAQEREDTPMQSFLVDPGHVNPQMWTPDYEKLLRRAASYPEVARIFVNPAIKKWLCDNTKGDRKFLSKITPIGGHDDHFHVRLVCPADNPGCQNQPVTAAVDGCGKGLDRWIENLSKPVVPAPPAAKPAPVEKDKAKAKPKPKPKPPLTLAQLPPDCKKVLEADPRTASQ